TLAAPNERGRVIGTVMSGLLLGILLARAVAGVLAGVGGWHTVYWIASGALLLTAGLLWRGLPRHPVNAQLAYPQLVASVLRLLRDDAVLRSRSVLGGLIFAGFSMFWTTLAFLLSGPSYGYGTAVIGLFGLIGAAGALAANRSGHWSDHGHGDRVSCGGLVMLLLSWGLLAFAPHSIALLIVGVLLDIAVQGVHIANQSVIYQRNPTARNRITSAYITCYFIGGAVGSTLGTAAYAQAGWMGVVIVGAVLAAAALGWVALSVARKQWK
ncbi:MFS transporter, partial [Xanthomonas oryzae]